MAKIRSAVAFETGDSGADNRTRVIAATDQLARDGHVLEPRGMTVANFLRTGTILFSHDPAQPVGYPVSAAINANGSLEVEIEWAPLGVSAKADEVRGLVKSGVLRAVSVGFDPTDMEPLDPKQPWGGQHITRSELLELSFVSVPADTGAVVTQRSDKQEIVVNNPMDRAAVVKAARDAFDALTDEEIDAVFEPIVLERAGKSVSAATAAKLVQAGEHLKRAKKHAGAAAEHNNAVAGHIDEAQAVHERAAQAHQDLGEAMATAQANPDSADKHFKRAAKAHRALGAALEDAASAHSNADSRNQDVGDSHAALNRSMADCARSMRSVPGDEDNAADKDGDSDEVQTSSGTGESGGSKNDRDLRRRQAELLAMRAQTNR